MSCLLPQFRCSPDSIKFNKTYNYPSSQLQKIREPIYFRTQCILATEVPAVKTESTVLNLEKLHLSSLEAHSNSDAADRPWSSSSSSSSSSARVLNVEKFQLPPLETPKSVGESRSLTFTGQPVEGDIGATLPSEFLTSEEAGIVAAAAEAVALAKAALRVAIDAAAMVNHHNPTSLEANVKLAPSLYESNNSQNGIESKSFITPSDEEVEPTNAVRSNRQIERKVRRTKAAEKAAASVFSVKNGSNSRKKRAVQEIDYSDPLRYLRGTTSTSKLLTATEEAELSVGIQDLLKLEKLHEELTKRCGGPPSVMQWAAAAGVDQKTLRERIHYGSFCKDKMIKSNIRLVISIAKNYQGAGMNLQDLVQEGCRGLVRGAEKFDASKGFKFSTYAHWWIKQAVRKSLSDQSRTIRLPFHMVEASYRVKEARKQLFRENGRHPDNNEVAEATGLSMKRLHAVLLAPKPPRSLDQKFGIDMDLKPSEVIADPEAETSEEVLLKQFMKRDLEKVLDTLNPREKQVVRWRFGLEDGRMKTLQEIGEIMGVSRERIRQIESCAFRKLKNKRRTNHLQQYILP